MTEREKSARLAPARSLKKSNPQSGLNFLRCAPLPPPPRGEAVGLAVIRMTADPSALLNGCVVGIRRPIAGGWGTGDGEGEILTGVREKEKGYREYIRVRRS